MPTPQEGETREEWLERCIPVLVEEGREQDEAVAICNSMWEEKDKKYILHSHTQQVYATKDADGNWRLEVLGAPYGGEFDGKDADGEYFSHNTNFMMDVGAERPVLYYHGKGPDGQMERAVEVIGKARVTKRNEQGLWFEVILDKTKKYAERIWRAAIGGMARASSGAINYLVRKAADGEILQWPIGELTLLDKSDIRRPANELATVQLKAAFSEVGIDFPKALLKSEELESDAVEDDEDGDERMILRRDIKCLKTKKDILLKR